MIVLPDAESHRIVSSFVWTQYRNVTDGETDRRTESLWLLQRSALRAMRTRCKSFANDISLGLGLRILSRLGQGMCCCNSWRREVLSCSGMVIMLFVRSLRVPPFTPVSRDAISVPVHGLSDRLSMKLATNIRHVNGKC